MLKLSTRIGALALITAVALVPVSIAAQPQSAKTAKAPASDPYPLQTCVVSGKKLGSRGDAIVIEQDGREIRLCCKGCVKPFKSEPKGYIEKIDKQIIASQGRFYPTTTCVVSGEALEVDETIDYVHNNRLVRLCCKGCIRAMKKDPTAALKKLDKAVVKQQREIYPLEICVVSGEKLDSDAVEVLMANRLVKLCCKGCVKGAKKNPTVVIAKVDAAWMAMHESEGEHGGGSGEHGKKRGSEHGGG